ncbi:hypothetical protein PF007_g30539 [Phytophthora fragariae]|uniref:Uncharacterized protein n=1 Tax=Phytophthora fragariae TaxID=53985 RepID=A0A6A3PZ33_9STRA|nr:hypothetical protein PF007_g30539 [Phytophthora fragariae]KAE9065579.1 hypothetical protein PF006_g30438 [Phytophthora fragariae]KAE9266371.1 hypothetical protein PF001_g30507 [Phytophthora fragariae]
MVPSACVFSLNTHLVCSSFAFSSFFTTFHVPFCSSASISSLMSCFHFSARGSLITSRKFFGSLSMTALTLPTDTCFLPM